MSTLSSAAGSPATRSLVILTDHEPDGQIVDEPLYAALRARGIRFRVVNWQDQAVVDPAVAFQHDALVLVRTTWNYIDHAEEFLRWTARVPAPLLQSPPAVIAWNSHKRYLLDLARDGVAVIPTYLRQAGERLDLASFLATRGWHRAVVKPAVSAGSRRTELISAHEPDRLRAGQDLLDRFMDEDFLVQPYIPSLRERGELSLVLYEGTLSHAFRKQPPPDSFAMLHARITAVTPSEAELALATRAMAAVQRRFELERPVLIARVDMVNADDGSPLLMELELIEPCLFFGCSDGSAERLACAIERRLQQ